MHWSHFNHFMPHFVQPMWSMPWVLEIQRPGKLTFQLQKYRENSQWQFEMMTLSTKEDVSSPRGVKLERQKRRNWDKGLLNWLFVMVQLWRPCWILCVTAAGLIWTSLASCLTFHCCFNLYYLTSLSSSNSQHSETASLSLSLWVESPSPSHLLSVAPSCSDWAKSGMQMWRN